MNFRVRHCCCSLATLVKTTCIVFVVTHFGVALAAVLWFLLIASKLGKDNSAEIVEKVDGQVEDFEDYMVQDSINDTKRTHFVIFILLLIIASIGVCVNLLVVCGIRASKRSLMLPWLVFHVIFIAGCFAGGIYVALHYTVLFQKGNEGDGVKKVLAVLCLFPMVAGILLIFVWILVDQQFIRMGRTKDAARKKRFIVQHTMSSTESLDKQVQLALSEGSIQRVPSVSLTLTPGSPWAPAQPVWRTTSGLRERESGVRERQPGLRERKFPGRRPANPITYRTGGKAAVDMKRSRSLEQMLDSNTGSQCSSGRTASTDQLSNYWIAEGTGLNMTRNARLNNRGFRSMENILLPNHQGLSSPPPTPDEYQLRNPSELGIMTVRTAQSLPRRRRPPSGASPRKKPPRNGSGNWGYASPHLQMNLQSMNNKQQVWYDEDPEYNMMDQVSNDLRFIKESSLLRSRGQQFDSQRGKQPLLSSEGQLELPNDEIENLPPPPSYFFDEDTDVVPNMEPYPPLDYMSKEKSSNLSSSNDLGDDYNIHFGSHKLEAELPVPDYNGSQAFYRTPTTPLPSESINRKQVKHPEPISLHATKVMAPRGDRHQARQHGVPPSEEDTWLPDPIYPSRITRRNRESNVENWLQTSRKDGHYQTDANSTGAWGDVQL